jgi:transposase
LLTDEQWAGLAPLIEEPASAAKDFRRTVAAISRAIKTGPKGEPCPPSLALGGARRRSSSRWSRLAVWERLLLRVQNRGVRRGLTFLDGTSIRAHQKAAVAA